MTSEAFKMKKLIEARSQCPEYKASDLYWDEASKQWLPSLSAIQRLARNEPIPPLRPCIFKKGDKVSHKTFGEGIVVANPIPVHCESSYSVDVLFNGVHKKVLQNFLKKI